MATYSSILAWRIPWTEEPGRLQSVGSQESDMTEQLNYYSVQFISVVKNIFVLVKSNPNMDKTEY